MNGLSDEDKKLWEKFKEATQPILHEKVAYETTKINFSQIKNIKSTFQAYPFNFLKSSGSKVNELLPRDIKDIKLQAKIDLHQYTLDKATTSLQNFLCNAQVLNNRWVLVITGKGKEGILKTHIKQWLSENNFLVSGYCYALPKHGGEGAFYVRVKRLKK